VGISSVNCYNLITNWRVSDILSKQIIIINEFKFVFIFIFILLDTYFVFWCANKINYNKITIKFKKRETLLEK